MCWAPESADGAGILPVTRRKQVLDHAEQCIHKIITHALSDHLVAADDLNEVVGQVVARRGDPHLTDVGGRPIAVVFGAGLTFPAAVMLAPIDRVLVPTMVIAPSATDRRAEPQFGQG